MSEVKITAHQARELLHGITEGPWSHFSPDSLHDYDDRIEVVAGDDPCATVCQLIAEFHEQNDVPCDPEMIANAALAAAAPDLARTVIALYGQIEDLL